jgi:arsenate reductase-like glutaredoxin family protein
MLEHASIIKRPVLNANGKLYVGFSGEEYKNITHTNQ